MLRIELKRNAALWYAPVLAGFVAWGTLATMRPDNAPTLWARSSIQLSLMFVVVACVMCGVGAWVAGRERRRQIAELLSTTPRPAALRDLALLTGTVIWGLVACLAGGAYVLVATYRAATWGGPLPEQIGIGLLFVVTGTAIGYLGGTLVPGRYAAPLVAVAFTAVMLLLGTRSSALSYLSPLSLDPRGYSPYDVFYRASPIPAGQMALWLAGLAGCALAIVLLRRGATLVAAFMLIAALVVATSGARLAMQAFVHPPWERIYAGQPLEAYEPVCSEGSIPVCVHPAYKSYLADNAQQVNRLVEPLLGIPGGPVRAEQLPARTGLRADGMLELMPGDSAVAFAAFDLVHEQGTDLNPAQLAIAHWLMGRVGEDASAVPGLFGVGPPDTVVTSAAARFAALPAAEQHAWLEENFSALRAGKLTLADLP
jgi:hypothetical protein